MINGLKNLFNTEKQDATLQPSVPRPKQTISEPVYAIERSMIEHPSRWKVSKTSRRVGNTYNFTGVYTVRDIKTGLSAKQSYTNHLYSSYLGEVQGLSWATEDEKNYLANAVRNMQDKKLERVERIRQVKKNKERQRLMEIYK